MGVRFGVEGGIGGKLMIVVLPWKTLGLAGLGPKAQSTARAQQLPACIAVPIRTREARGKLPVLWDHTVEKNYPLG